MASMTFQMPSVTLAAEPTSRANCSKNSKLVSAWKSLIVPSRSSIPGGWSVPFAARPSKTPIALRRPYFFERWRKDGE